jgi:5-methylcytosine-specific restriction endonuclease McrA
MLRRLLCVFMGHRWAPANDELVCQRCGSTTSLKTTRLDDEHVNPQGQGTGPVGV